jgi:hypothetical protein
MDDFTDALMIALHAGADDPDRSAMASRIPVRIHAVT